MSYDYETMGEEVLGDDVLGYSTVGAVRPGRLLRSPAIQRAIQVQRNAPPPAWRSRLAPGVPTPGYGMQPLPLVPQTAGGVFAAATTAISFQARPQAPFRSERLLASVRRSGAAGVTILAVNFFVGRDLQMVELGSFDIEFFAPGAFGVRLALSQAEPGQLIRIDCQTSVAPAGADTLSVSLLLLGQTAT
jgi:hypothetical protein